MIILAASRISWLAKKRRPANAKTAKDPKKGYLNGYGRSGIGSSYVVIPASNKGRAAPSKTRKIARDIRFRVRSGWPSGALEMLSKANLKYLTKYEEAVLRADIAHGYFIYGKDNDAIAQAKRAIAIAGRDVPQAYWTAGIAAWRKGDIDLAMVFFQPLAENEDAPSARVSAAAFWLHAVPCGGVRLTPRSAILILLPAVRTAFTACLLPKRLARISI